ncbi:hypothetical protein SNE35_02545 [Paucibacter sp. R3-3]|uniref:Uncharacterized protein n=1 Tax=Roseateles agri TaxID=3098619 RepID=A0ABU5DAQ8_9BURK|nr:hypothetical protein [Paucibacter sp. R3-3]MDY0743362.1 hypothetical protein [Paucibacter sp. R3-3]
MAQLVALPCFAQSELSFVGWGHDIEVECSANPLTDSHEQVGIAAPPSFEIIGVRMYPTVYPPLLLRW